MNTPFTDEASNTDGLTWSEAAMKMKNLASRLEQDREIFRQALIKIYTSPLTEAGETILQAFRDASAFPGEMHEP